MKKLLLKTAAGLALSFAGCAVSYGQTIYMVSNAHLDSQWNWDVQTSINEYVPATLYRNLTLMERYPDYVFNCESGIKHQWMKEYYPDGFEKLRKYVQNGQWHISGSCWEASDANVPSTEALNRNILYGQQFYEQEFGVLSTDIFLPDCFGFGQQLPTVAAHCGLIGFSTQKLQWRNNPFYGQAKEPFPFGKWRGMDGSEIYVALQLGKYSRKFQGEDLSESEELVKHAARSPLNIGMFYYGVGDVGGSPTIPSVQSVMKGVEGKGPVKIISAASDQLFKDLAAQNLPVETWDGELLMDVHGTGCYTSQAAMKLFNRRNELLADAAERSSSTAELLTGSAYPVERMREIWRRFIWHQFHDDLTGTSIPRAYEFSWNDEIISLLQSQAVEETAVAAVAAQMDTRGAGESIVVYNPSAFARKDIVSLEGAFKVYDSNGKAVTCQISGGNTLFMADVQGIGFRVYSLKPAKSSASKARAAIAKSPLKISNSVYTVTVDTNGDITSILDKRSGRELVEAGKAIRLTANKDNKSHKWPAWEITKETVDGQFDGIYENVGISLYENGAIRKTIRIHKSLGESDLVQYVSLYEGEIADRIDIRTEVDWQSTNCLLKAEFPLGVSNPQARYDIGTGSLLRDNNTLTKYEVYAQQWADLTAEDGSYGVSIMNDCKYGWDKPADNTLRLTLLHTPETKNRYVYQDHQDLGHHEFTYSIVGHREDWNACGTVNKAERLNQPLRAFFTDAHPGKLGKSISMLNVPQGTSVKAFKKAEDGDGYIVRLYEVTGKAHKAELSFGQALASAEELNGIEKALGKTCPVSGKKLSLDLDAFALKTLRVRFSGAAEPNAAKQATLEIPYDTRAASYNSFRADGNFDASGNSYAAELLPESILHRGINFPLADPMGLSALRCNGEQIRLPEGRWNKLYLLVAATRSDLLVPFKFSNGNEAVGESEAYVPYFSGFVGQWGHTGHTEGFIKDADIAYVGTHTHSLEGNKDKAYEFTYMFCVQLDVPEGATTLIVPENRQVALFSAVAVHESSSTQPASDQLRIAIEKAEKPTLCEEQLCLAAKHICGYSGEARSSESARMLVDEDTATKWCDPGKDGEKYVAFDLGSTKGIKGWYVLHAGRESRNYITKDFCLQVRTSEADEWKTVDEVRGNLENVTDRTLEKSVSARFVRLVVTAGEQGGNNISRIYEFQLR